MNYSASSLYIIHGWSRVSTPVHKIFSLELQRDILYGKRHTEDCARVHLEDGAYYVACTRSPGCSLLFTHLSCLQGYLPPSHDDTNASTHLFFD